MKRVLLTAIVLLAAANLPLSAQSPSGPVQGAVQRTVKGTATVGQGVIQGADRRARALPKGLPTSREAPDKLPLELLGALAPWP